MEEGNYVLIRDKSTEEIAQKHKISPTELKKRMDAALKKLKKHREGRAKPRLDDKILASWNGLMLNGLVDAYRYLGDPKYLDLAIGNALFLEREMMKEDHSLFRNHKDGESSINAFLEDYATIIEAYLNLYEVTFDEKWLKHAKEFLEYAMAHFLDKDSKLFFFTSDEDLSLIRRSIETSDNVISASNSIMAKNLLKFHKLFPEEGYGEMVSQMLKNVQENFDKSAQGYANWLHLVLFEAQNFYEIAVVGDDFKRIGKEIASHYLPHSVLAGTAQEGGLDLFENRFSEGKTLIYLCIDGACKLPVTSSDNALQQLTIR